MPKLILKAFLRPRVSAPLFHRVNGRWRVNSIEFIMRTMK